MAYCGRIRDTADGTSTQRDGSASIMESCRAVSRWLTGVIMGIDLMIWARKDIVSRALQKAVELYFVGQQVRFEE
jgi:hypothetical protein